MLFFFLQSESTLCAGSLKTTQRPAAYEGSHTSTRLGLQPLRVWRGKALHKGNTRVGLLKARVLHDTTVK